MTDPKPKWKYDGVRVVHSNELDINTPQTPGMNRAAAITHARAGAEKLWAGTIVIHPKAKTGAHLVTSLLAFNVGVELGQLAVLVVLVPLLSFLFRYLPERIGTIIISLVVGHTAWHWLLERWERLSRFPWPTLDAATLASAIRWLIALLVLAGLAWIVAHKRSHK